METDRRAGVTFTPDQHAEIARRRAAGDDLGAQRLILEIIDGRGQRRPGLVWWLTVGWWWRPCCWAGRVLLWLVAWPLGLWRSLRHSQRKAARR